MAIGWASCDKFSGGSEEDNRPGADCKPGRESGQDAGFRGRGGQGSGVGGEWAQQGTGRGDDLEAQLAMGVASYYVNRLRPRPKQP